MLQQDNPDFLSGVSWGGFINLLKTNEDKKFAVTSQSSTSGYWYPREEVLKIIGGKKSFSNVSHIFNSSSEIVTAVCNGAGIIAGAVADFKYVDKCPGTDDAKNLVKIKTTTVIPYGAFVISLALYEKLGGTNVAELFDVLQVEKRKAYRSDGTGYLVGGPLQKLFEIKWLDRNFSYYAEAQTAIEYPDIKKDEINRNRRNLIALVAALAAISIILLIVVKRRAN